MISNMLLNTGEPYRLKVGDMVVTMEYSDNQKTFKECMLTILKQKTKMN